MACFCPFNRRNREGQKKEGERRESQEKQGRERERMAESEQREGRREGRSPGSQGEEGKRPLSGCGPSCSGALLALHHAHTAGAESAEPSLN